jgi:hypothetical protein
LVNEDLTAGKYKVEIDVVATHPITLASEIYFYQRKVGILFIDTKKNDSNKVIIVF